jgi:hypothetical protein
LLEDLQKNKPRIIVDMAGNEEFPYWNLFKLDFFPELSSLVKNSYKQITDVRGAIIYERIER